MPLMDSLKEHDQQQEMASRLDELTSRIEAMSSQLSDLVQRGDDSAMLTGISASLTEIARTLDDVSKLLGRSEAVKLPDGSSMRRSDISAYEMMTTLSTQIQAMISSSDELAEAVTSRGRVRVVIDTDEVTARALAQLDDRLGRAIDSRAARVEETLDRFEHRVVKIGQDQVEAATKRAQEVVRAAQHTSDRIDRLAGRLTWTTVGRICIALTPLALVVVVVGSLVSGAFYVVGAGPLLGWAWDSFRAAPTWWGKVLIATGTLGGIAGFSAVLWWLTKKVDEQFRGW